MTRNAFLAAVGALAASTAAAEPYDVDWFLARPDQAFATVNRCQRDARLNGTPICGNARAAAAYLEHRGRGFGGQPRPPPAGPPPDNVPYRRPLAPRLTGF